MAARTPLYDVHLQNGAKMVDFHGWELPLHYGSQLQEHHATRQSAGMFDVSHMTIVDILGAGGRQFLRRLLTNDVDKLSHRGKALYSCMCNERGGIIDDLVVYQREPDNYRIVLNANTRVRDLEWIRNKSIGFAVGLQEHTDLAMLAIQGPEAIKKTLDVLTPMQIDAVATLLFFECVQVNEWFFARTGYTGEDGLEIILPASEVLDLWQALLKAGVRPCGLGARDTLRLEAGLLLHGQDMDETTTPLESGLGWTITWDPGRDFIGVGALLAQRQQGVSRKLIGLILEDKGIMRAGQKVIIPDQNDGIITSGSYSPTLGKSIALARVPAGVAQKVSVVVRDKHLEAKVCKFRFLKQ